MLERQPTLSVLLALLSFLSPSRVFIAIPPQRGYRYPAAGFLVLPVAYQVVQLSKATIQAGFFVL